MNNYNINTKIPINLISGIKSDQKTFINYKTFSELVRYSYKVAGTVGYMFCKIIKENKKNQILRGIQLGIAMQLTNICRDIEEDLNMNRIYFPRTMRSFREEKNKRLF